MSRRTWTKNPKEKCIYCGEERRAAWMQRHVDSCYLNPENLRECAVCDKPLKSDNVDTCSHACSNTYYRSGINHPNHNDRGYRIICFHYHEKQCIVCDEENIVEVHHYDGDKKNNDPRNLIPLCSTHHKYVHSKFKHLIIDEVEEYIRNFESIS